MATVEQRVGAKHELLAAAERHHSSAFRGCRWPIERVAVDGQLVARQHSTSLASWWKKAPANDGAASPTKRRSSAIVRWLTLTDGEVGLYDNRYRLCASLSVSKDVVGWSRTRANSHLSRSVAEADSVANSGRAYLLTLQLRAAEDGPATISVESLEAESIARALEKAWVSAGAEAELQVSSPRGQRTVRRGSLEGDLPAPVGHPRLPRARGSLEGDLTGVPCLPPPSSSEEGVGPVEEGVPPMPSTRRRDQPHEGAAPECAEPEPELPSALEAAVALLKEALHQEALAAAAATETAAGEPDHAIPDDRTTERTQRGHREDTERAGVAAAPCTAMVTNTADANEDSGSDSDADPDVVDEPSGSSSEDEYDESLQHACGTFEQLCASPRPETGGQSSPVEGEKPAPALSTGDPTTSPLGKGSSSPPRRLPSILKSAATTRPRKPRRRARRFSVGSKRYRTIKFPKDELRLKTVYPFLLDESEMEGKRGALAEVRANRKRDKEWKERFEATRRSSDSDDGEDWTTQGGRPRRSRFSLRASPLRASKAGHRENPLQAALQHDSDSDSDSDEDTAGAPSRRGLAESSSSDDEESSSSDDEESSSSDDDESSSSDDDSSDGEIDADGEARTGARRKSPSRPPLPI